MEREPNHSEKQKAKWEELVEGPSPAELSVDTAEQVDIESSIEDGEEIASPEWVHKFLERFWEQKKAEAPGYAEQEADGIMVLDKQFIKRRQVVKAEGGEMSEKEFLVWERDYSESWKRLQGHLRDGELYSMEDEADVESAMFFTKDEATLHETIEAQAGAYYRDRARALREAIRASDDPHKEEDEDVLYGFFAAVSRHLDYKYMTPEDIRLSYGKDYHEYDQDRTFAHNNAIRQLNKLNDLARKYGTTPFTPRQFWTSEKKDQTPAVSKRMRYDRDVVEEYYAIAFSEEVAKRDRLLARALRGY